MSYENFEKFIDGPLFVAGLLVQTLDKNPQLGFIRLNESLADAIDELREGMRAYACHPLTPRERCMLKSIYRALSLAEDAWLKGVYRHEEMNVIRREAPYFLSAEE